MMQASDMFAILTDEFFEAWVESEEVEQISVTESVTMIGWLFNLVHLFGHQS
jgi:hypothetical protein